MTTVDSGTVRIAFHRPEIRNAFRPATVDELVQSYVAAGYIEVIE